MCERNCKANTVVQSKGTLTGGSVIHHNKVVNIQVVVMICAAYEASAKALTVPTEAGGRKLSIAYPLWHRRLTRLAVEYLIEHCSDLSVYASSNDLTTGQERKLTLFISI